MSKLSSKLSYSKTGYESLKTIIPQGIARLMGWEHGDTLVWDVDVKDGEKVVVVRRGEL